MMGVGLRLWFTGALNGLSQAYGTANVWFGLAIAVAMLALQPLMFVNCGYAVALALLFSRRFDPFRFEQGLYLFNPFLFGCFAFAAFGFGVQSLGAISIGVPAIVLLVLRLDAAGWRSYYFTLPYIVAAYLAVVVLQGRLPRFPAMEPEGASVLGGVVTSFAQVLLSADFRIGLAVLLTGLAVMALPTIAAFLASALLSLGWLAIGLPASTAEAGLVGYNAVIFSLFVGRELLARLPWYAVSLFGGSATHVAFHVFDVSSYTFPFVVSGWIYVALRSRAHKASADATSA